MIDCDKAQEVCAALRALGTAAYGNDQETAVELPLAVFNGLMMCFPEFTNAPRRPDGAYRFCAMNIKAAK